MLALGEVDLDELERDSLLVEYNCNTTSAGGQVETVKLENHVRSWV